RGLGVREWFEAHNPTAERQMIRRLRDAVAKGYWSPDAATRQALEARLAQIDSPSPPGATTPPGFGQGAARPAAALASEPAPAGAPSDLVRGQVLEPTPPPAPA